MSIKYLNVAFSVLVVTEMELTSKGCFDKCSKRDCKYGPGSIHINAVTYTSNSTGLFVAVLHQKTGSVIQTKHLTRSSQVEFSNYSSFFESIPVGSVVAVATRSVCKYDGWYALIARYLVLQDSAEGKEPSKPDAAVLVTCRYQCPADIKGDNFPYQDIAGSSHGPRSVKLRLTFPGNRDFSIDIYLLSMFHNLSLSETKRFRDFITRSERESSIYQARSL